MLIFTGAIDLYREQMQRNQGSRFFFVNNDQNNVDLPDQTEESKFKIIDEQKDEFNANDDSDAKDSDFWIDVKKDTDTLDNEQIKELIEETLFGDAYKRSEEIELSSKLERFSIDDWPNVDDIEILPSILRNPEESLVKREKSVHLTFDQKLQVL